MSPSGSDAGAGTIVSPYLTFSKAFSVASSGDIVQLLPGNYTVSSTLNVSVGVSINGTDSSKTTITSNVVGGNAMLLRSVEGTNGNQKLSNFKLTTTSFATLTGIDIIGRSNVTVDHVTIRDFHGNGVFFSGTSSIGYQPINYASGNRLQFCQIINNSDRSVAGASGNIVVSGFKPLSGGDTGMVVRDNVIVQTQRVLGHNGDNFVIPAGPMSSVEGLKYFNNKSYRVQDDIGGDWSFHMELWDCQGGVEIFNSEFYGGNQMIDIAGVDSMSTRSFALHSPYRYNFSIHDCLFQIDTAFTSANALLVVGVDIEADKSNIHIFNNRFKNLPYAIMMSLNHAGEMGQRDIYINHNLIESGGFANGDYAFDFSIIGGGRSALIRDLHFDNNTIVNTNTRAGIFISLTDRDSLINSSFSNNIITGVPSTGYGAITFSDNRGFKDSVYMQNNLLFGNTNSNNIYYRYSATAPTHFFNTGTIIARPLFKSDYTLQPTSPAIGAAIGGADIGAIPYSISVSPSSTLKEAWKSKNL